MKLSVWARRNGLCYQTAWRMFRDRKLPVEAQQLATGTILVTEPAAESPSSARKGVAIYARVSSHDQEADLDRQIARLVAYATGERLAIVAAVKEIGSGLNGRRSGLTKLLRDPTVGTILIEHRDRLARFGVEYLEAALSAQGRKIVVVDDAEVADDVVRDLHEIIVSLCARLYGKRSARNRARRAMTAIQDGAEA